VVTVVDVEELVVPPRPCVMVVVVRVWLIPTEPLIRE